MSDSAHMYLNLCSLLPIEYTTFTDGTICLLITTALFIGAVNCCVESFHIVSVTVLPPVIFATNILLN